MNVRLSECETLGTIQKNTTHRSWVSREQLQPARILQIFLVQVREKRHKKLTQMPTAEQAIKERDRT